MVNVIMGSLVIYGAAAGDVPAIVLSVNADETVNLETFGPDGDYFDDVPFGNGLGFWHFASTTTVEATTATGATIEVPIVERTQRSRAVEIPQRLRTQAETEE